MPRVFNKKVIRGKNKQSEQRLQAAIMKYIRTLGAYCVKVPSGMIRKPDGGFLALAPKGTSDIVACVPVKITPDMVGTTIGAFVAVEVKKDDATVRAWLRKKDRIFSEGRRYGAKDTEQNQAMVAEAISFAKGTYIIAGSFNGFIKCLDGVIKEHNL